MKSSLKSTISRYLNHYSPEYSLFLEISSNTYFSILQEQPSPFTMPCSSALVGEGCTFTRLSPIGFLILHGTSLSMLLKTYLTCFLIHY